MVWLLEKGSKYIYMDTSIRVKIQTTTTTTKLDKSAVVQKSYNIVWKQNIFCAIYIYTYVYVVVGKMIIHLFTIRFSCFFVELLGYACCVRN